MLLFGYDAAHSTPWEQAVIRRRTLATVPVAAVRAGAAVEAPVPPLVTVVPGSVLALWALGAFGAVAVAGWLASRRLEASG